MKSYKDFTPKAIDIVSAGPEAIINVVGGEPETFYGKVYDFCFYDQPTPKGVELFMQLELAPCGSVYDNPPPEVSIKEVSDDTYTVETAKGRFTGTLSRASFYTFGTGEPYTMFLVLKEDLDDYRIR